MASASSPDSPSRAVTIDVDKQGFLEFLNPGDKNFNKKYKSLWWILIGGSLFAYRSPLDASPLVTLTVSGGTVGTVPDKPGKSKGSKQRSYFHLKCTDLAEPVQFATINIEDRDQWVAELTVATGKAASEAPEKQAGKRSKGGLIFRAKKSVVTRTATSGAGKGMMRRLADEDTRQLLTAMKKVVTKHANEKRATEIENSIIKTAVKCYLLVDNKSISGSEFLQVDAPLREAFELTAKIFDRVHRATDEALMAACQKVEVLYANAEKVLENLMLPHVKQGSILRLKDVFSFMANAKFLFAIFRDESLEDEVHDLVKAMEYYTQFHYTKEDIAEA